MLRFTLSERGEVFVTTWNISILKKRVNKSSQEWQCCDRKCTSTMSLCTSGTSILREPRVHTCAPVLDSTIITEEAVGRMKIRAPKETTSITKICSQEVVNTRLEHPDLATDLIFPSLYVVDSSLYRQR